MGRSKRCDLAGRGVSQGTGFGISKTGIIWFIFSFLLVVPHASSQLAVPTTIPWHGIL